MVSVLALNRLELREMINQEMIANPVLEEQSRRTHANRQLQRRDLPESGDRKSSREPEANPFDELTWEPSSTSTWIPAGRRAIAGARGFGAAIVRKVSFLAERAFRSSGVAMSVTICSDAVKEIRGEYHRKPGRNGYLTASTKS